MIDPILARGALSLQELRAEDESVSLLLPRRLCFPTALLSVTLVLPLLSVAPILLLLLLLSLPVTAGEAPPLAGEEESGRLTVRLLDAGHPLPGRLTLIDASGKSISLTSPFGRTESPFTLLSARDFSLPLGQCTLWADAGPRRLMQKHDLFLTKETLQLDFELSPFFPVSPAEWILFHPYLNDDPSWSTEVREETLKAWGCQAAGLTAFRQDLTLSAPTVPAATPLSPGQRAYLFATPLAGGRIFALSKTPLVIQLRYRKSLPPLLLLELLYTLHEQGAYLIWCSPTQMNSFSYTGRPLTETERKQEALLALSFALATIAGPDYDAISLSPHPQDLKLCTHLLDLGYRPRLFSNGPARYQGEQPRFPMAGFYLPSPPELTTDSLFEIIRSGHQTVGNGPFLSLIADHCRPGDILVASRRPVHLQVTATSSSSHEDSIGRLEIIYNGRVIDKTSGQENQRSVELVIDEPLTKPGWLLARYVSREPHRFAVTNPIIISGAGMAQTRGLVSRVHLRGSRNGNQSAFLVEVWNHGRILGRFPIPVEGRTLTLPCTAILYQVDSSGKAINPTSLLHESSAESWLNRLSEEPEAVEGLLVSKDTYEKLRFLLGSIRIVMILL